MDDAVPHKIRAIYMKGIYNPKAVDLTDRILNGNRNIQLLKVYERLTKEFPASEFDALVVIEHPNLLTPERLQEVLAPHPAEGMEAYPVSTYVNRPVNDGPECVVRIAV